jgi:hypothetical protein
MSRCRDLIFFGLPTMLAAVGSSHCSASHDHGLFDPIVVHAAGNSGTLEHAEPRASSANGGTTSSGATGDSSATADSAGAAGAPHVDTSRSNREHCGAAGIVCPPEATCEAGACLCPQGEMACGSECVDTKMSRAHCGGCGVACKSWQICVDGSCTCPAGLTECAARASDPYQARASCADLRTDTSHCGECDNACQGTQSCVEGQCRCPDGLSFCDGLCVDLKTDPNHCGSCGNTCAPSLFCADSGTSCIRSPCDGLCSNPEVIEPGPEGYRIEPLGTEARCLELWAYAVSAAEPRIICWEFEEGRSLRVNGSELECASHPGAPVGGPRALGYCIEVSAGEPEFAGLLLPQE